jgi:hypothetical protein
MAALSVEDTVVLSREDAGLAEMLVAVQHQRMLALQFSLDRMDGPEPGPSRRGRDPEIHESDYTVISLPFVLDRRGLAMLNCADESGFDKPFGTAPLTSHSAAASSEDGDAEYASTTGSSGVASECPSIDPDGEVGGESCWAGQPILGRDENADSFSESEGDSDGWGVADFDRSMALVESASTLARLSAAVDGFGGAPGYANAYIGPRTESQGENDNSETPFYGEASDFSSRSYISVQTCSGVRADNHVAAVGSDNDQPRSRAFRTHGHEHR